MPRKTGADSRVTVLRIDSVAVDGFERGRAVVLLDPRALTLTVALSQTELIELPCHGGLLSTVTLHTIADTGQLQVVVDLVPAAMRSPLQPNVVVQGVQSATDAAVIVGARRHLIMFHDGGEAMHALVAHASLAPELGDVLVFASTLGSSEPPIRLRELHPISSKATPQVRSPLSDRADNAGRRPADSASRSHADLAASRTVGVASAAHVRPRSAADVLAMDVGAVVPDLAVTAVVYARALRRSAAVDMDRSARPQLGCPLRRTVTRAALPVAVRGRALNAVSRTAV